MIIAGTGHRPHKLGGYTTDGWRETLRVATLALEEHRPTLLISGMAQGWDQALAKAAVNLGIKFAAYIPFVGQERLWTFKSQAFYHRLLEQAVEVQVAGSLEYADVGALMKQRNNMMVNASSEILALWDGSSGGTMHCINYARRMRHPIYNYWNVFVAPS